ncbi:hypothetical protein ACMU_13545 [Actibacterium mucosum KCTC 23349]|uniref:LysM domain-containing protein n=2 Tax=Actibacterium TaxID=1433986 RepID=A0A037ZGX1_9RHOB|nr:hypothetical protein ACMU_13545 [Actibacterium mucosum KCTC 23349]
MHLLSLAIASATALPAQAETVTVAPGDTLATISRTIYGQINYWRRICDENFDQLLGDCDRIKVGMVLALPPDLTPLAPSVAAVVPPANPNKVDEAPAVEPVAAEPATSEPDVAASQSQAIWAWADERFNSVEGFEFSADDQGVSMSGYVEKAKSSGRPGIWVRLPDAIEQTVSGKTVEIIVEFSNAPTAPIAVAYSTNDVGNSKWRQLLGNGETSGSFVYEVPPVKNGKGDFIGFLPNVTETGQTVVLTSLEVALKN